jgi:Tfp pilus assembly protein PilV
MSLPSRRPPLDLRSERGALLIEVMVALVFLAIGILAIGRLFPAGSRSQLQSRMTSTANFFVQQKAEELMTLTAADPGMTAGRHPAGSATEALGSGGAWQRFYQVDLLAAPLSSVRRITINVSWNFQGARSVVDTIYVRR